MVSKQNLTIQMKLKRFAGLYDWSLANNLEFNSDMMAEFYQWVERNNFFSLWNDAFGSAY